MAYTRYKKRSSSSSYGSSSTWKRRKQDSQYQKLLKEAKSRGLTTPGEVSRYIVDNRLWKRYPSISGRMEFESGGKMSGAVAPGYYSRLCSDLGFERASRDRPRKFRSYDDLGFTSKRTYRKKRD